MIRPVAKRSESAWPSMTYGMARQPRLWSNGALGNPRVPNDDTLAITEPPGTIPTHPKARISGWGEPPNFSAVSADSILKLQGYLRQAERGDTYNLFAMYRDIVLGHSHILSEAAKRKMVVAGQPYSLQPYDKENPEDKKACDACKAMIDCCENWDEGLMNLMDAQLWPVAVTEKIFDTELEEISPLRKMGLRVGFKKFFPVNPALLSYRVAYTGAGVALGGSVNSLPQYYIPLPNGNASGADNDAMIWNPDDWNADLRIYNCESNGIINFSPSGFYKPEPDRHIVFRESVFSGIRDNMGGTFRSIYLLWALSVQGRDWWARGMERFGAPFTVIMSNLAQSDTIQFISQQLQLGSKLNGLVLQTGSKVDLKETSTTGMAEGYKMFQDFINDEISKVICGQVSSSGQRKSGGMNSGQEKLQSEVRDDLAMYDKKMVGNCLRKQLFEPFLRWNGLIGQAPYMRFGGHDPAGLQMKTQAIGTLFGAGIQPTDEGIETLEEELGIGLERAPVEAIPTNGNKDTNKIPSSKRN